MTEAVRIITEQVRLRVRRDGVDLAADDALADQYVRDEVRRYSERALGGSLPLLTDEFQATREVVAALTGFGALQPFLDDPDIEEIWINSPSRVFVARDGVPELTPMVLTEREVRDLVERMLQASGPVLLGASARRAPPDVQEENRDASQDEDEHHVRDVGHRLVQEEIRSIEDNLRDRRQRLIGRGEHFLELRHDENHQEN